MKNHRFKLEKVLDYRKGKEDLAQQELACRQKKLREEKFRLHQLSSQQKRTACSIKENCGQLLDLEGLRMLSSYMSYLEGQIKLQNGVINQCSTKVEEGKHLVKEAMMERKTLEKLKEKQYQQFLQEEASMENKLADEIGIRRFSSQSSFNNSNL